MGVCRGAACFFLGSGLLLAGLVLTPTVVAAPSSVPQSVDASAGGTPGKLLRLQAGSFDPVAGAPPLPGALAAPAGPQNQDYYIVQFNGTVLPEWRAAVEAVGGVLYGYVPDHAYLVKLSKADVHRVRRLPEVRWVGLYEPGYRVSPGLFGWLTSGEEVEVLVAAFEPDAVTTADTIIRSQGGRVHDRSMGTRPVLRARVAGRALPQIARVKGIAWVEEYVPPELLNDVAGGIMHADDVWLSPALAGAGQIVAIADTGLDVGVNDPAVIHPDLLDSDGDETRIVGTEALGRPPLWDDPHGHGTHVAGSVLGNGHQSLDTSPAVYRGAAPEASLYFQSVLDYSGGLGGLPSDLGTLFGSAYDAGARIHTNSWGSVGNEAIDLRGTYTTSSWQIDDYAWSHRDLAILFAAGNAGVDTSPADGVVDLDSLTTQATAKNCITIGASENYRADQVWTWSQVWPLFFPNTPIADDRMADNAAGIAAFSGRGPTDDGRIKPDLVAPGTWVISTRTGADSYNIGFESGELSAWQNVVPGPGWQVSDVGAGAHSGRYVLSNGTPAVSYAPNLTTRIYSPFLDFSRYGDSESAELSVWMKYNLRGSDYILVYICGWDTGGLFNYTTKRYDGSTGGEWVSETFRVYRNQLGWPQSVYAVLELNTAAGPVPPGYYCLWDDFTWAANSTLWGVVDDDYVQSGGTSMATPLTAGGVALVRQHYTDDLGITPSSALLKATLIATADDLTPGQYPGYQEVSERPDRSQGWGRVNLRDAIAPVPPAQVLYWDRSTGLGQGASDSVEVGVTDASVPLRVALVWTDPPTATPAVVPQLVNDLDLVVTDPSSGTHLAMGGVGDHLNNVENVDLASPELGVHTVTVIGHDVNGPDQPYALVIYGAATAACGDTEPPSAPTLQLAYPLSATRINLDWTDSTDNVGVDHYEVYRDDAVTAIRPSSSYQDSSLCPVTTYTYHVVAVDACGNRSEPSNERAVTTYALAAPYNIVATPLGSWGMSVGWTKGHPLDEVSGYEVSRDGGAGQSVELPPFFEQGLTAETTYTYRVRAFGVCGHEEHASGWSDPPGSGETGRLAAPEGLAAELADGWGVNLTWVPGDALDQIEGYYVYRTDKLPNPMGQTSGLSYRDSTAPAETSCSYYVVVYDAAGHTSPPSDTVSAPTTPPLPAPVGLTYAYKTSPQVQVDLTWYDAEPLAPKAGFRIYREGEPRAERDYPLWSDSRFSGLQTNRQYEYRVSCYDAAGHESALSDPVLVRTETPSGDTVGVYTSGNGLFYLRHFSSTGYADVSFRYGPAPSTWLPIAGDWDGNGTDTIGLYNPVTSIWYLRNTNSGGNADVSFRYGSAPSTCLPIAGDWDGNGTDTIGLYNPVTGIWYLRNSNSAGVADTSFRYGPAPSTWLPVTGDWNDDGTDTVGLYDPVARRFYLRNSNTAGQADLSPVLTDAPAGSLPVAGDWEWNANREDTIGAYAPATRTFRMRNSNTTGASEPELRLTYGAPNLLPIVGNWDGLPAGEFSVCAAPSAVRSEPDVSARYIVWSDARNGNSDVYAYDRATAKEFAVCTEPHDQVRPRVDGDTVVWEDYRAGASNRDIYGYTISTRTEFIICDDKNDQHQPAISGDLVIWSDKRHGGNSCIYGYSLSSRTEARISFAPGNHHNADIDWPFVVWENQIPVGWRVYCKNLDTGDEFYVYPGPARQYSPSVSGDWVVWADERSGAWDIYAYNLRARTGEAQIICGDPATQGYPDISGRIVVWGDGNIHGYDLASRQGFPICTNGQYQHYPAIFGDTVVWSDRRIANWAVFGHVLRDGMPVP